jgi:hypothetical protein
MQDTHHYLDPVALAKVRNLEMQARLIVEGYLEQIHRFRLDLQTVCMAQNID